MPESPTPNVSREAVFDRITRLVRNIFDIDVAAVSLIRRDVQQFRSIDGLELTEIPLEQSFCRATWREGRRIVIPDTAVDSEFSNHPLVTDDPYLRSYVGFPLQTTEGEPIGTMCAIHRQPRTFTERELEILKDLADLAAIEFELHEWATVDALTGALTRRVFTREVERLSDHAAGKGLPTAIILFDVDHFKTINDRFGHGAGDTVLSSLVAACQANLRPEDLVGRHGGEEFVVAMQGGPSRAVAAAERLRAAIAALKFTFDGEPVSITASFGVGKVCGGSEGIADAIARADKALYAAKAQGRNRTVVADDDRGAADLSA